VEGNTLELLALMQHHGAPTRLLDFTRSPYVAAYFAVEDAPVQSDTHHPAARCAVWACDENWLQISAGRMLRTQTPELTRVWEEVRAKLQASGAPIVDEEILDGVVAGSLLSRGGPAFEGLIIKGGRELVLLAEPERLSERLSVQQGVFVTTGQVEIPFMQNLRAMPGWQDAVRRLTLPRSERGVALSQLRLMNITRASLFPGLDGFAQSFRQLLVRETRQARVIREAIEGTGRTLSTLGPEAHRGSDGTGTSAQKA
jgi:hypothetical protein